MTLKSLPYFRAMAKNGITLPFGWSELIYIITVISGLGFGYAKLVSEISTLENNMEEARAQIEALVEKHIVDEEQRMLSMEEQLKWYQKEFNLNPLSWRKKNKK